MYKKTEPNSFAFPTSDTPGLTKREYIAAQIMAAMLAGNEIAETYNVARDAVLRTDQLIAALNRAPTST